MSTVKELFFVLSLLAFTQIQLYRLNRMC